MGAIIGGLEGEVYKKALNKIRLSAVKKLKH